jgi:hypothetical protein
VPSLFESRDGLYSEGPAKAMDSREPHLRNLLSFMGIANVAFVRAENLAFGPEARQKSDRCGTRTVRRSDSERNFSKRHRKSISIQHAAPGPAQPPGLGYVQDR